MTARRWTRLVPTGAVVALVAVAGSGCGVLSPGTASTVGGERISDAQVREVTSAFCDLIAVGVRSGQSQPVPLAQQKQQLLTVLIETRLNRQFAEDRGVSAAPEVTAYLVSQLAQGFDQLSGKDAEVLDGLVQSLAEGRAALAAVAAQESGGQQVTPQNLDQLQQSGLELRQEWQKGVDIETDARYAPDADGSPGGGSASVSEPASTFATQAVAASQGQDPGYAAALPASQRCGG